MDGRATVRVRGKGAYGRFLSLEEMVIPSSGLTLPEISETIDISLREALSWSKVFSRSTI